MFGIVRGFFRFIFNKAARATAESVGGQTVFSFAPVSWAVVYVFVLLAIACVLVGAALKEAFWVVFGGAVFAVVVAEWPSRLVADCSGLTSCQLLRREKHIQWSRIRRANFNTGSHTTTIVADNGVTVIHTGFHCDAQTLHALVEARSPVKVESIEPTWTGHRKITRM